MKKMLLVLSIFMVLPQISNAGLKTKAAIGIGGFGLNYYKKEIIGIGVGLAVGHVLTKTEAKSRVSNIINNINDVLKEDYSLKGQLQQELVNEAKTI